MYEIENDTIKSLKVENEHLMGKMARSNYSPPEIFTNLHRKGCIQNEDNIPIIYHIQRHCAKKAIYMDLDNIPAAAWTYAMALPKRDRESLERLKENYWWLQGDAKHMDELRRRARFKMEERHHRQRDITLTNRGEQPRNNRRRY